MIDSQKRLFKGLGISTKNNIGVAPHVGAWIETRLTSNRFVPELVAPHVGAWIETDTLLRLHSFAARRTPCGCVD